LIFLDNAASSQMPQAVIDRWVKYRSAQHANIHRAVHYLSETATAEYEKARLKVQAFINAKESRECIFTSGTTDGINLVAQGYGRKFFKAGDEIILTTLRASLQYCSVADGCRRARRKNPCGAESTTAVSCWSRITASCSMRTPSSWR